jgi:ubiquinone/menaquinone biosynthesis C-methylase UbiE
MQFFLEIHRDMPRQGPGDDASTRRAFSMLSDLPASPDILDIGCGSGAQTLQLAELSDGLITAVDMHRQYLVQLEAAIRKRQLQDRIRVVEGDMEALDFPPQSFDVLWAEGAIYIMGFERALREWRRLLRPGGFIAVTEATWWRADPPPELARFWAESYPAMQDEAANLAAIHRAGYRPLGSFRLPDSSWWADYYDPLTKRLDAVARRYAHSQVAMEVIAEERREMDIFRKYSDYYGYAFYVMQLAP